jgi:cell division septum initiation protein DivIVA
MSNDDSQGRERDVGERIASLIHSIGHGPGKPIRAEEQEKLKAAASRLDRMLEAVADADWQVLKNAALRLDQMLVDIRKGKDVTFKRREQQEPKR